MIQSNTAERRLALLTSAMAASILLCGAAAAQSSDPTTPETGSPSDGQGGQIEDIVVTAQRRSESQQSVPIALQSFSQESLQRTAVRGTEDLTSVVGGLVIQQSGARPSLFLRGIGNNSSSTTPAVLTFVDGVYMPFGNAMDFANVARIEVLKGPQGTLFGRNATGGVLQITTTPPSEALAGRFEVGYGNYETVNASAYVTGGITPGVAMDVALSYHDQNEGFGTNIFNGDDVFLMHRFAARSRLRVKLSEVSTLTLSGDYDENRGTLGSNVNPAFGYDFVYIANAIRRRGDAFFPGDFDLNAGPLTPFVMSKQWGTSLTFETEFSDLTFRSISSYRKGLERAEVDFDGGPANIVRASFDRDPRTSLTQELQLLSESGKPLEWVAGLYYYRARNQNAPYRINVATAFSDDLNKSIATYAQASYEILPRTKLTLGGRYTIEKRDIDGYVLVHGVDVPERRGSRSQKFKEPTWRVAIDHKLNRVALVYVSASRGFNGGFFNQNSTAGFRTTTQNPEVKPEFLTAYEVGTKLDLLGRRLRINLSGFLYDYTGLQQQIYDQNAVITINAGSAEIKGIDFEITAKPISSLTLSVSGTYLDAKYKSYPKAPNYKLQANGSIIAEGNADAAGKQIVNAPEWSYTASASHLLSTPIGKFETSANLNYRGRTFADPGNRFPVPTRYVLNLTERWTSNDDNLFASVWVKNALDKRYDTAVTILTPIGLDGLRAPPRTYGMTIGYKY